ncbi:hypothetical protein HMN09_00536000 [Mycena chlorophos]|uniref:Fungal-type protein kinase domain-containing protein n=1 Tax=Mycena chlorophos TaxID=658473 RepID=A0A8H6WGA9_MYCCL|nr:hypothetical protein HMN09_00536000 [Mycena chlorophos]
MSQERQKFLDLVPPRPYPDTNPSKAAPPVAMTPLPVSDETEEVDPVESVDSFMNSSEEEAELQRDSDNEFCRLQFANRVVVCSLEEVLCELGGLAFRERYNEFLRYGASLDPLVAVQKYQNEFSPTAELEDLMIDGTYWLVALCQAESPTALDQDYFPMHHQPLPRQHDYSETRSFNAALRSRVASQSTIFNILSNVEFSKADPPPMSYNPLVGTTRAIASYQRVVRNASYLLAFQGTRLCVPTLSFHGDGGRIKLLFSILNHDCLKVAIVDDCLGTAMAGLSALLTLLRNASPYELGFNPLFTYASTPAPGYCLGDMVPLSLHIPGQDTIPLGSKALSRRARAPFARCTLVLESLCSDATTMVVKLSFVSNGSAWRERTVVEALFNTGDEPPSYSCRLLAAFATLGSPGFTRGRHLEIMLFESPRNAQRLDKLSTGTLLEAGIQLFECLLDLYTRGFIHRDISSGNVLFANGRVLIVDWETGRRFDSPFSDSGAATTGTLDTMSVASLRGRVPLPHDDAESATYVLLKALMQTYTAPSSQSVEWEKNFKVYRWDIDDADHESLIVKRASLWGSQQIESARRTTHKLFIASDDQLRADFVQAIFSMALPMGRWIGSETPLADHEGLDAGNYEEVLASLKEIVGGVVTELKNLQVKYT